MLQLAACSAQGTAEHPQCASLPDVRCSLPFATLSSALVFLYTQDGLFLPSCIITRTDILLAMVDTVKYLHSDGFPEELPCSNTEMWHIRATQLAKLVQPSSSSLDIAPGNNRSKQSYHILLVKSTTHPARTIALTHSRAQPPARSPAPLPSAHPV